MNEFKVKRLNEERKERLRKKKLKNEAKKTRINNNITTPNKDTSEAMKEDYMDKNNVEIVNDRALSIEYGNGSCSSPMVTETDSSCADPHSCALDPVLQTYADTSENDYAGLQDIEHSHTWSYIVIHSHT